MRQGVVRALRTARRTSVRKLLGDKTATVNLASGFGLRAAFFSQSHGRYPILKASMYTRNWSIAFLSTIVGSGAWYAFRGTPSTESGVGAASFTSVGTTHQTRGLSTSTPLTSPTSSDQDMSAAEATRRAIVVDNDQFYVGAIQGNEPLSKYGQGVLEMLTPDQATEKLRRNEESYLVGRGRGVVRYDIVQIPSNNPIEDDHAEKIVEVPASVAQTQDGSPSSDWMFWGVFDGHR